MLLFPVLTQFLILFWHVCFFLKGEICESEVLFFIYFNQQSFVGQSQFGNLSATRLSALHEPSVHKYYYLSESVNQQVWKYTSASDPAITKGVSGYKYNLSPSSQADSTRLLSYPLLSFTFLSPLSVSGAPPLWLVTPPSRAQWQACDVGVHDCSMHRE